MRIFKAHGVLQLWNDPKFFCLLKQTEKFSLLHKDYATYSGAVTGRTEFFGSIVSPSISHRNCCGVRLFTSSSLRGHTNLPCSSLLYSRRKPSFSQTSPLILSDFRPQNRYSVSGTYGLIFVLASTMETKVSIPDLKSVYPQTMYICLKQVASFNMSEHPKHFC